MSRNDKNMKPKIPIVDEGDNIIGYKDRDSVKKEDIYRVSALWITNSNGEILLAQRAFTKSHNPGKWGPSVAGTVEEGEDYKDNIVKEAEEEIGLKNIKPLTGPKIRRSGEYNYFGQWYLLEINKPIDEFIIDRREVESIKWFLKKDLLKEIENHPDKFLENMKQLVELFCK
mgnify:CR=1 FL=1